MKKKRKEKKRKEKKRKEEGERERGQTEQTGKTHLCWGVTLPGTCAGV
jgi:hypothetical protein